MKTRDFFVSILSTLTALALLVGPATGEAATRGRFRAETVLNDAAARISSGGGHSCQVNEDGTIRCWGSNQFGQLGNGTTSTEIVRVPGLVTGITSAVAVSAGPNYTCALLSAGSVRCWGQNGGILGDGTVDDRPTPVAVVGLTNAVAIATGANHACALLADGTARCWGGNSDGRLGDGTTTSRLTPVTVSGIGTAVAIAMGYRHTCALLANGSVRCWGENVFGQLGIGSTGANRLTPVTLSGVSNAIAITAATYHTCVLLADGTARCWGLNGAAGVLGDGTTVDRNAPVTVSGLSHAVDIDTGDNHTCALQANSNPKCWGFNANGQLGDGTTTSRLTPVDVITPSPNNAVAVSAGGAHSCALLADGSAKCWGNNQTGQLGISNVAPNNLAPTPVLGGGGGVAARDVAAGRNHTCAVRADGTVACWGANDSGQLGDGTTERRLSPVPVSGLTDPAVAIAAGEAHTCALVASGTVRCWGLNSNGQLGDGTTTTRLTPVTVPMVNVIGIAAGGTLGASHTCALLADGTVRCWGFNGSGQLGDGSTLQRISPVAVFGMANAVAIAVGEQHSCALLANGFPFCWGLNIQGQLGEGTNSTRLTPIITNLENTVAIAGGNGHTCALRVDGTSWCWGGNLLGQLGIGSTTPRSVPSFTNAFNVVGIAGGFGHSCALQADGKALCWGDNGSGQLGNATTTPSLTPSVVGSFIHGIGVSLFRPSGGMVGITTGRRHSCALISNGRVTCWGENTVGQLGIGSTENQSSPVTVSPFTFIPGLVPDGDVDGIADSLDNCPSFANATQADADGNGRGDACECGDQNADGRVNVADTVAINQAIFDPTRVTPLCDANNDGICNVSDIVAVNRTIFSPKTSVCARQPVTGP